MVLNSLCKNFRIDKIFGGQASFSRILNKASLCTESNAFDMSTKVTPIFAFCSIVFSIICLEEKIISTVERFDLEPLCVSSRC